jgi:hypothetical protein
VGRVSCTLLQDPFITTTKGDCLQDCIGIKRRISVIARAAHEEEEISEKFHLDRVENKSESGVSITKLIVYMTKLCLTQAPHPTASGPLPEERTSPYWVAKLFGAVEPRYRFYVQSFQE